MRKFFFSLVACGLVFRAGAQIFTPESWNGAVLGGLVGGIIGNNSHGRTGEGIAIGAGAGWLLGTLAHENRYERGWYSSDYSYTSPQVSLGFYAHPGVSVCYGYAPAYAYERPGYYLTRPRYVHARPSYALSGAVVGGIAGGIIGHNSHHQTAAGAAIGAGTGLVLGSIADTAVAHSDPSSDPPTAPGVAPGHAIETAAHSSASLPPNVPNSVRGSVVSARAQPVRQIPDAPRVPDAPTF